jgi:hypothetical protein
MAIERSEICAERDTIDSVTGSSERIEWRVDRNDRKANDDGTNGFLIDRFTSALGSGRICGPIFTKRSLPVRIELA